MFELIAIIILLISLIGVALILYFKASVLATLPKNGSTGIREHKIIASVEGKISQIASFFSDGKILHKFLSRSKCKIMKVESLIDGLLHGIRKKAKEKKLARKK